MRIKSTALGRMKFAPWPWPVFIGYFAKLTSDASPIPDHTFSSFFSFPRSQSPQLRTNQNRKIGFVVANFNSFITEKKVLT